MLILPQGEAPGPTLQGLPDLALDLVFAQLGPADLLCVGSCAKDLRAFARARVTLLFGLKHFGRKWLLRSTTLALYRILGERWSVGVRTNILHGSVVDYWGQQVGTLLIFWSV